MGERKFTPAEDLFFLALVGENITNGSMYMLIPKSHLLQEIFL